MCGSWEEAGDAPTHRGLTRRRLLGGAAAALGAWGLAGCAGIHGRRLDELDPRVPALLAATTSVDFHTHAAGAGNARAPRFDLADHMRRGHWLGSVRAGDNGKAPGELSVVFDLKQRRFFIASCRLSLTKLTGVCLAQIRSHFYWRN